jgi:ribosomal protein L15
VQADGLARLHCAQIEVGRAAEMIARRKTWAAQLFSNAIVLNEFKKLYVKLFSHVSLNLKMHKAAESNEACASLHCCLGEA